MRTTRLRMIGCERIYCTGWHCNQLPFGWQTRNFARPLGGTTPYCVPGNLDKSASPPIKAASKYRWTARRPPNTESLGMPASPGQAPICRTLPKTPAISRESEVIRRVRQIWLYHNLSES